MKVNAATKNPIYLLVFLQFDNDLLLRCTKNTVNALKKCVITQIAYYVLDKPWTYVHTMHYQYYS